MMVTLKWYTARLQHFTAADTLCVFSISIWLYKCQILNPFDVFRHKSCELCICSDFKQGVTDLKSHREMQLHKLYCIWEIWGLYESRCSAKLVGYESQSRALMNSLHASLCLTFPSLHLLLRFPSPSSCPLMHLDQCWGLCILKWFSYVIRSHRGNKALTFSLFSFVANQSSSSSSPSPWNEIRTAYKLNKILKKNVVVEKNSSFLEHYTVPAMPLYSFSF